MTFQGSSLVTMRKYKKNVDKYAPENPMTHFTLPACDGHKENKLDMNAWLIFFGGFRGCV